MARVTTKRKVDLAALKRERSSRAPRRDPDPVAPPPDESVAIGFHLRRERGLKKLLLKDVADAPARCVTLISQIETNKVSASLSTLHKVAKALGTSVSALFAIEEKLSQVVYRPEERPIAGTVQA